MDWMSLLATMPSAPREVVHRQHAAHGLPPARKRRQHPARRPRSRRPGRRTARRTWLRVVVDLDQLDLEPFLGEEALFLRDEQRPEADPGEIADPQRLGLRRLVPPADATGRCQDDQRSRFAFSLPSVRRRRSEPRCATRPESRAGSRRRASARTLSTPRLRPDVDRVLHRLVDRPGLVGRAEIFPDSRAVVEARRLAGSRQTTAGSSSQPPMCAP